MSTLLQMEEELLGKDGKRGSRADDRHDDTHGTEEVAQALGRVGYHVHGTVPELRQPKSMDCWATVAAMLMSWHDRASMSIETALGRIGAEYLDMFTRNTGLPSAKKADFVAAVGLMAEPPMSYTVEGWEQLLRKYGPLWVTTDERAGPLFSLHACVMTGLEGDGAPRGTTVHFIDPASGRASRQKLHDFLRKFEEVAAVAGPPTVQVVHYPSDAQRATGQSYTGALQVAPAIAGAALTYQIVKDLAGNTGDITWEREKLTGAKHPRNDATYAQRGTWQQGTFRVDSWLENLLGDRISATFEVNYHFNGYSLGHVTIDPVGTNDAFGWKLQVMETIIDLPDATSSGHEAAAIQVSFVYRFSRPILNDAIWRDTYTLLGDGVARHVGRWEQ